MKNCVVYILSDSIGDTGELIAKAAASQFGDFDFVYKRYPYLIEENQIKPIIAEAATRRSIVVFTTVIPEMRSYIIKRCKKEGVFYYDVMRSLIYSFKELLQAEPKIEPGIVHKLDDTYFSRVKAIEFAVKYDDGRDLRGIKKAEVVLLGISRTSKTPLSMYLANKNVKVANIPLVPEVPIPKEIFEVDPIRIFGLINTPEKLLEIRSERLKAMGLSANSEYARVDRIYEELEFANKLFNKIGCPVIDVSNKAIEETASLIMQQLVERKLASKE